MSFFRTYIDPEIQTELFNRIDSLNFNQSDKNILASVKDKVHASIHHQYVKACWARASAVLGNSDGGKVVTINSNLDSGGVEINEPLNINSSKENNFDKYRGRPGITSINSSFKEYFMKESTINFYIPNPNDFDEFKKQFLRFGRYVMVEWGWSLPFNFSLPKLDAKTVLEISKNIQSRILAGNGNYTALVGVVTNYNFNLTKEGGYEADIQISSMGRNIIGQKSETDGKIENLVGYVNSDILEKEANKDNLNEKSTQIYSKLRNTFFSFNATIENLEYVIEEYLRDAEIKSFSSTPEGAEGLIGDDYVYQSKPGVLQINNADIFNKKDRLTYCTWGWFEDFILNSFFSFTSKDNQDKEFKTEFRSVFSYKPDKDSDTKVLNNICNYTSELYSLGFDSIILPGHTKEFDYINKGEGRKATQQLIGGLKLQAIIGIFKDSDVGFKSFTKKFEGKTRGQIRNMVFEVGYLKETFTGTQNIELKLSEFWKKVSNDYGGYWNFAIVEDPNVDGRMMVTDINIGKIDDTDVVNKLSKKEDATKIFKFSLYSSDSMITDFQIQSENSSEMATMAVYGANTGLEETSADMGKGYTTLAMRALSMLDNSSVSVSGSTVTTENEKNYYDSILNNISNPIYQTFVETDGKESKGSSAKYKDDGSLDQTSRTGGIVFSNINKVTETFDKTEEDLADAQLEASLYDTDEKSIREAYYWFEDDDKKVQIYNPKTGRMYDEFKRTMLYNINKAPGEKSNYSTINPPVPIQLSLSLQGIGGLKVGDLFYVDYLPKQYRDYCHFMIVNVEHSIDTNGWTTKLDSRMIVDIPKIINDKNIKQTREFQAVIVESSLSETVSQIKKDYEKKNTAEKNLAKGQKIVNRRKNPERLQNMKDGKGMYAGYEEGIKNFVKLWKKNITKKLTGG